MKEKKSVCKRCIITVLFLTDTFHVNGFVYIA